MAQRARLTELWRAAEGKARLVLVDRRARRRQDALVEEFRFLVRAPRGGGDRRGAFLPGRGGARLRAGGRLAPFEPLVSSWDGSTRCGWGELARLPDLHPAPAGLPPPAAARPRPAAAAVRGARRGAAGPGRPLLLVADDLHWADRETLQFLHYLPRAHLGGTAPGGRDRPARSWTPTIPCTSFVTGLRALELLAEVEVGRLSRQETAALAERLLRGPLEAADTDRLHAGTEGNPLFVVEAIRAGWSGRDQPAPITPRVQADRVAARPALRPARDLVGVAATIGREFSTDVLAQASQAGEEALVAALDELWRRRLVRDQGLTPTTSPTTGSGRSPTCSAPPGAARHHLLVARALERLHAGRTRRRWPPSSPPTTSAPASPRRRWPASPAGGVGGPAAAGPCRGGPSAGARLRLVQAAAHFGRPGAGAGRADPPPGAPWRGRRLRLGTARCEVQRRG